MPWAVEFVLLTDGSLQVTSRSLQVTARRKGDDGDTHVAYLAKRESDIPPGLPIHALRLEVPKPARPDRVPETAGVPATGVSEAIGQPGLQCSFTIEPTTIAFDPTGGDAHLAVHAPSGCAWTSESDSAWLSVTAGSSGTGDSQVVLHASTNTGDFRAGTAIIGGVRLFAGQNGFDRTREIPGLTFGPNYWSVVRITNPSALSRAVKIDIYRESGDRLRINPVFDLMPRETLEVFIQSGQVGVYRRSSPHPGDLGPRILENSLGGATPPEGECWVRIAQIREAGMPDLEARAFVEVLNGNQLTDFERGAREPREMHGPVAIQASEVRGQQIYFLNISDQPTTVAFCVANKVQKDPCANKDSSASRYLVKPNQFLIVSLKNIPQKYVFVESSKPGKAILARFAPATGTTRVFSSETSISFGEPAR